MKERLPNAVETRLNANELISQVAQSLANNKYSSFFVQGERKASAVTPPGNIANRADYLVNGDTYVLRNSTSNNINSFFGGNGPDNINGNRFSNFEASNIIKVEIMGGEGEDTMQGHSEKPNNMLGNRASDSMSGGNGNDTIDGGKGLDTIDGGNGSDIITGGAGSDVFVLNKNYTGVDTIIDFRSGQDKIGVPSGTNLSNVTSTAGEVFIDGKKVANLSNGATVSAADIVEFNVNQKSAQALPYPTDSLNYQAPKNLKPEYSDDNNNHSIFGDGERSASQINPLSPGNYVAIKSGQLSSAADFRLASPSDKTDLFGTAGEDTFSVGSLISSFVINKIFAGKGNDVVIGTETDDNVNGGLGNDLLSGNGGDDTLSGGKNDDTLEGWRGNDILTGGQGTDIFKLITRNDINIGTDSITDFNPLDGDKIEIGNIFDSGFTGSKLTFADIKIIPSGFSFSNGKGGEASAIFTNGYTPNQNDFIS